MPLLSFEIARVGKTPLVVQTKYLDSFAAAWREVEALASAVKNYSGASIRVKGADGGIVILAGVATALATIERYRRPGRLPQNLRRATTNFSELPTLPAELAHY